MELRREVAVRARALGALVAGLALTIALGAQPPADDPLIRMPGTQPGQVTDLPDPSQCFNCHAGSASAVEPGYPWQGSMMAQAARDFLFWASLTVAAQDSRWALGRPNATDLCLRCHLPEGWLEGRSTPTDGSAMAGSDFDGVHCAVCHRMWDPFFVDTGAGTREGDDWTGFWDESGLGDPPSDVAALATATVDQGDAATVERFNGLPFFGADHRPVPALWTENGGGQVFVSVDTARRASFADANASHATLYSRHHKSSFFCGSCHDVSNAVLHNLPLEGTAPGDGTTDLPSETDPAFSYFHVERTFSEFRLSAYGQEGGAAGTGPFAPEVFHTSRPGDVIASCQDCHLPDAAGRACSQPRGVVRPAESLEHPNSGVPLHDFAGGNAWVPWVLASAVPGASNHDPANEALLAQGAQTLTLDLTAGMGLAPEALLSGSQRALSQLGAAASVDELSYDPSTGLLAFRVVNHSGHKLPSGYPEGRRLWVEVRLLAGGEPIHVVNPYSAEAGTLKGLGIAASPSLVPGESHVGALVYEAKLGSTLTGEAETFHFVLGDHRVKDNRIPPLGFRIAEAAARLSEPVWAGVSDPEAFSVEEYAGGFDRRQLTLPAGGDRVELRLYYQTTSREYVEFLRDEINGAAETLSSPTPAGDAEAYVAQTDPFFSGLAAWGDTVWSLWSHNRDLPGAAPVLVAEAALDVPGGGDCAVGATDLVLEGMTVTGEETWEACASVTTGPDFRVGSTGAVVLRAGQRIVLRSGSTVAVGGTLRVVIDPSLAAP